MRNRLGIMYLKVDNKFDLEQTGNILSHLKFVPFRVEHLFHLNKFKYEGVSKYFEEVPIGNIIPEYTIVAKLAMDKDGKTYIKHLDIEKVDSGKIIKVYNAQD